MMEIFALVEMIIVQDQILFKFMVVASGAAARVAAVPLIFVEEFRIFRAADMFNCCLGSVTVCYICDK